MSARWMIITAIIIATICGGAWKMNRDAAHERNLERYNGYLALKAYRGCDALAPRRLL